MTTITQAILSLKTEQDVENFLRDLCTPGEIRDFEERWLIAQMLDAGDLSYRQIAAEANASITTVSRVARFLKDEPHQGYRAVLDRLNKRHRAKAA